MIKKIKKSIALFLGVILAVTGIVCAVGNANKTVAAENTGVTALKSYVGNMNLKGYVGNNVKNNIKYWQTKAYENNKNIIDQIAGAKDNLATLDSVLGTDYFGVDKYYNIDIAEKNGKKALGWTLKNVPSLFSDRDMRFAVAPSAVTDWTGATELWVKVDATEISAAEKLRIAFEENVAGRESYELIPGAEVRLIGNNAEGMVIVGAGGYVELPAEFEGFIILPLNTAVFSRYFNEGGNGKLDLGNTVQFQLALQGGESALGKTFYITEFGIAGMSEGDELPVSGSGTAGRYKTVWDFAGLGKRTGINNSSLAWYGEFVGKLLTGIAYSYRINPTKELFKAAEDIVDNLAAAQGLDGYLGVFVGAARYSIGTGNWDLWNQYHCITGLLEWYKITGNETALEVAKKAADCIYETFKSRSYLVAGGFETNRAIAHGYAQLYEVTREKKYLAEAERIINEDCQDYNGWYKTALRGGHFYATSSNRWEVLHMIMTLGILYEQTGKTEYYEVLSAVWQDILENDIHNGGGFTTNESANGNPYSEGVIETCCTIAWAALTNEYYKYNKTVAVADELERTYFNALLGSLLDNDKYCTYNTPMNGVRGGSGTYDGRRVASQQDISFQYNSGSPDMNCCQANIARGLGQLSQWAAVTEGNELYLNYFGNCAIETEVGGENVIITESTSYPLDGKINVTVSGLDGEKEFTLKVRVPQWAYGSAVNIDGETRTVKEGEYLELKRNWKNGDAFTLNIARYFTYWTGEAEQTGLTSVYYGPVLLTLDEFYAPGRNQKQTYFSVKDFENAVITSGTAEGCWMFADVESSKGRVRLVDFASAGKYGNESFPSSYWSWLSVTDAPQATSEADKKWMNSDKHKVCFGAEVSCPRFMYYEGETVAFKPVQPAGKTIDRVTAPNAVITSRDGTYSFVMPSEEVEITILYKDAEFTGAEDNKQNPSGYNTALIVCSAVAAVAAAGAALYFIGKKVKNNKR